MTLRRAVAALVVAVMLTACGYSEAEMQGQRNQIEGCRDAVVQMSTEQASYEAKIAALTAANARLTEQLQAEVKP